MKLPYETRGKHERASEGDVEGARTKSLLAGTIGSVENRESGRKREEKREISPAKIQRSHVQMIDRFLRGTIRADQGDDDISSTTTGDCMQIRTKFTSLTTNTTTPFPRPSRRGVEYYC